MIEHAHPEDLQQLVRLLARGRPKELARASRTSVSSLYRYMAGTANPRAATLERLIAGAGLSLRFAEAVLLPAIRTAREARLPLSETFLEDLEAASIEFGEALAGAAVIHLTPFLAALDDPKEEWEIADPPPEAERRRALDLFDRLEPCAPDDRRFLIETCPEYQTWALAELLRDRSQRAAADPASAKELAALAQFTAERARSKPPKSPPKSP
jgi:transcriptional regulator with XRE-family HTH domain